MMSGMHYYEQKIPSPSGHQISFPIFATLDHQNKCLYRLEQGQPLQLELAMLFPGPLSLPVVQPVHSKRFPFLPNINFTSIKKRPEKFSQLEMSGGDDIIFVT